MQMFVIVATRAPSLVRAAIKRAELDFYPIRDDAWFVIYDGTSRELAKSLEIYSGKNGSGIIAPITSYSGRASKDLWEWLRVNWPDGD